MLVMVWVTLMPTRTFLQTLVIRTPCWNLRRARVFRLFAPVVTYYFQRRKFIEDDGFTEYAGLWMLGIMLYILGITLASFFIYLVLEHLRPNFIYDQAQAAIKVYSSLPEMRDSEVLLVLKRMVNEKLLPSPIEMVFNVFWFVTFAGSVSSAISALIAQRSIKRPIKKN